MAAVVADHIWTLDEIVALIHEKAAGRRPASRLKLTHCPLSLHNVSYAI
jgi:hypothetical protein